MTRMIINNHDEIDDWQAIDLVRRVVDGGRISNNDTQYCYATTFKSDKAKYVVAAEQTETGTDVFHIYLEEMEG